MKEPPVRDQLCDLIFDLDGTIVDSCQICIDILTDMLVERGSSHRIEPIGARAYMSHGGETMVRTLLGPSCGDPARELAEFRCRYALRTTPHSALFPGVVEHLTRLADLGHRLAICSNKPQNLCENALADTGLAPLFDVVVGGQTGLRAKPHTDLVDETLRLLGSTPAECVFIGDSELDHQAAEAVSMPFVFLTYGYADPAYRPIAEISHDHFADMCTTLAGRRPQRLRKARRA